MKGDFSRMTFDKVNHFRRVLMQQGRVQLDADWNEQAAILLHYMETLAADLIGPYGGPGEGFKIAIPVCVIGDEFVDCGTDDAIELTDDFYIMPGHYYVDGILCENEVKCRYTSQPDYPVSEANGNLLPAKPYLVYLDVWERHISYIEDEKPDRVDPSIREVALGGVDTTTRSKVVWQVKTIKPIEELHKKTLDELNAYSKPEIGILFEWSLIQERDKLSKSQAGNGNIEECELNIAKLEQLWAQLHWGRLRAQSHHNQEISDDPCITSLETRYRGVENQLYRVEIHIGSEDENGESVPPTFKWSRDNGTVVFPVEDVNGPILSLVHLGCDDQTTLHEGDWVEVVNDDYVLLGLVKPLLRVEIVDRDTCKVTLSNTPDDFDIDRSKHPLLRRWDQRQGDPDRGGLELTSGGTALIEERTEGKDTWLTLENDIQVSFESGGHYYSGDYWLIPARTETGDVEWPKERDDNGDLMLDSENKPIPEALPPHGVEHHYGPLAIISDDPNSPKNCRKTIIPLVS